MAIRRPGPVRWLWYAFGGRLPDRYRQWVLHDVTVPTWRLRYGAQIFVRTLPFLIAGFVALILLPDVSAWLAVGAMALALLFTLYFTLTSSDEFRNVRLVQHGFPPNVSASARGRP
jgi:hypothetical protein